ncbi:flagellar operon protein [Thermosinus carboxydivorans Nor1]|uniref:Flagellar operon protein n=2 Tax=Thermosinus TaxID=261684 RepID=A1HN33_9FIRM|nr:flagellar operon protein [Thermosinus carboxydivorans Nor1]
MMADNRIYYPQRPIGLPNSSAPTPGKQSTAPVQGGSSFGQVLEQYLTDIKFSQHALQRLQSRNIQLNQTELVKLNSAVEKAARKGAKESLILMDNLALVVSIRNKTVITAIDGASIKENVFTNIDSAVIV